MAAGAVMVMSAVAVIVRTHRRPAPEPGSAGFAAFRRQILPNEILVFAGILLGYTIALDALGFVAASFLFLVVSILYLQRSGVIRAILISAGSIAIIYLLFRVIFTVVLPRGWLLP
jgi:hypothetical protein